MRNKAWFRKNWLLVAGLSLLGIHTVTYLMQKFVKKSTRLELKQKNIDK
ncbi:uncharacterized protein [Chiloscyllium punctatum]